jgi:hypothetical protein
MEKKFSLPPNQKLLSIQKKQENIQNEEKINKNGPRHDTDVTISKDIKIVTVTFQSVQKVK